VSTPRETTAGASSNFWCTLYPARKVRATIKGRTAPGQSANRVKLRARRTLCYRKLYSPHIGSNRGVAGGEEERYIARCTGTCRVAEDSAENWGGFPSPAEEPLTGCASAERISGRRRTELFRASNATPTPIDASPCRRPIKGGASGRFPNPRSTSSSKREHVFLAAVESGRGDAADAGAVDSRLSWGSTIRSIGIAKQAISNLPAPILRRSRSSSELRIHRSGHFVQGHAKKPKRNTTRPTNRAP